MPNTNSIACKHKHITLRADAGIDTGIGHVMRLSALGAALVQAGCDVTLIYKACPENLLSKVSSYGIVCKALETHYSRAGTKISAEELSNRDMEELIIISNKSFLIMDGYQFNAADQKLVKEAGLPLLFLDDYGHCEHYHADLVLNQNASASASFYLSKNTDTRLLLGTDYVLLRPEFQEIRKVIETEPHQKPGAPERILISMGGSDSENTTSTVLQGLLLALRNHPGLGCVKLVTLILGAANPNIAAVERDVLKARAEFAFKSIEFQIFVNAQNMANLLTQHDLVLSAGGTTVFETAFLGKPNLVLTTADNQDGTKELVRQGAIMSMGRYPDVDPFKIATALETLLESKAILSMPKIATKLVDGKGIQRVIQAMNLVSPAS